MSKIKVVILLNFLMRMVLGICTDLYNILYVPNLYGNLLSIESNVDKKSNQF